MMPEGEHLTDSLIHGRRGDGTVKRLELIS